MKKVRYEYKDDSVCTEDFVVISDSQTFGDWLAAGSVRFEQNGNCAPRRRAGSLTGEKPVRKGLTNHR